MNLVSADALSNFSDWNRANMLVGERLRCDAGCMNALAVGFVSRD
jgi:hypothetical protein